MSEIKEQKETSLSALYYRYGKTEDEKIKDLLKKVKLVKKRQIGASGTYAYYPLTQVAMKKIIAKPRNVSLTFDATETTTKQIKGFVPYMEITFLVKSSSRFFLKPDVGEIIDQIPWEEFYHSPLDFQAICMHEGYETLDGTEGEHFVMQATLLKSIKVDQKAKLDAIKQLHNF
jgi:hypothetical protein